MQGMLAGKLPYPSHDAGRELVDLCVGRQYAFLHQLVQLGLWAPQGRFA